MTSVNATYINGELERFEVNGKIVSNNPRDTPQKSLLEEIIEYDEAERIYYKRLKSKKSKVKKIRSGFYKLQDDVYLLTEKLDNFDREAIKILQKLQVIIPNRLNYMDGFIDELFSRTYWGKASAYEIEILTIRKDEEQNLAIRDLQKELRLINDITKNLKELVAGKQQTKDILTYMKTHGITLNDES
ncbi:MAG: hypothetical protein FWG68_10690 [Defluviitaleaceae bacterium]|nr:hypothetical protein [Defluviitaleaceae bacterium]